MAGRRAREVRRRTGDALHQRTQEPVQLGLVAYLQQFGSKFQLAGLAGLGLGFGFGFVRTAALPEQGAEDPEEVLLLLLGRLTVPDLVSLEHGAIQVVHGRPPGPSLWWSSCPMRCKMRARVAVQVTRVAAAPVPEARFGSAHCRRSRLRESLPAGVRGDAELAAVLGHGPPGHRVPARVQLVGEFGVRQRPGFRGDDRL